MLEIIVFTCGAVVMILELVGSRILAPYLGTSIVVWTSLIGIILGSLSIGYYWGGKLADEKPNFRVLSFIILLAAFFIGSIALSKTFLLSFLQRVSGSIHAGSTMATLFLFAPPSVLLGMISPYAVKLKMSSLKTSGSTVGNLYALSTAGSIFGTFFAGFFLISFLGSTNIIILLALVLVVTSFLAYSGDKAVKAAAAALCLVLFMVSTAYDAYMADLDVHDIDTGYSRILVYNTTDHLSGRSMRVMVTNPHGKQSAMYLDDQVELASNYTKFYKLAAHFNPDMQKVLMIGGGGYSFPKYALENYPDVKMDVIEIDPRVTEIARKFFGLGEDPRLRIFHEDARVFLNRTDGKYDVVLCDAFNSHYSIPFHLTTVETVQRLHDILEDDGVVLSNVISAVEGDGGRFLRAEIATFKALFPQVYIFQVYDSMDARQWQNFMLLALKGDEKPSFLSSDVEMQRLLSRLWKKPVPADVPLLTDDFAPVDRYVAWE